MIPAPRRRRALDGYAESAPIDFFLISIFFLGPTRPRLRLRMHRG